MIETKEDWWALVDDYWETLLDIGWRWMDLSKQATSDGLAKGDPLIKVSRGGDVWEVGVGAEKEDGDPLSIQEDLERSKGNEDWERLRMYFGAWWMMAPDKPEIHEIPGWGVLCDLCSEDWVFRDEP